MAAEPHAGRRADPIAVSLWNECSYTVLSHMVRISSRQWSVVQIEHLTALIEAGTSAARTAIVLKRSIIVVRAKARSLGKSFQIFTAQ
jgi:hypothetical protein